MLLPRCLLFACLFPGIWLVPRPANGQTFTNLYSFGGYQGDARQPQIPLAISPDDGVLYGTTYFGGTLFYGAVFSLAPPASAGGSWTETVLWNFGAAGDGQYPIGGVLLGPGGVIYGTAGGGAYGQGTVYALAPPASSGGAWTETLLYSFTGGRDGAGPQGALAIDKKGVLFGATSGGGTANWGAVFSLSPPVSTGAPWTEATLHSFTPGDGLHPTAGVVIGSGGVLYGSTVEGGSAGLGAVFSVTPPASPGGPWSETIIHSFTGSPGDGVDSFANVTLGGDGVLYGMTTAGGSARGGTVFSLTPSGLQGGDWTETILYNFGSGNPKSEGWEPRGGLVLSGETGALYGTTEYTASGPNDNGILYGVLFELTPPAPPESAWTLHVLHTFAETDGANPYAGLVRGGGGILYGTTQNGGDWSLGAVFSFKP
jgi:uncharacterized repeat protein (TIGR03803 family)